ncbi:MAG: hypothetical protein ACPGOV_16870 [Magnetovibrionaceae bacterium]
MDLMDFEGQDLYFDEPMDDRVSRLLDEAAMRYPEPEVESLLAKAKAIAPDDLSVFVAFYRTYYYRHDYAGALEVAEELLPVVARRLNLPGDWSLLTKADLDAIGEDRITLLRFYLMALKGAGYLLLRLDRPDEAFECLDKVRELDDADRLGAGALAETARQALGYLDDAADAAE